MNAVKFFTTLPALTGLLALAACGGGSGDPPPGHATISTLAYVESVCHEDAHTESASQRLQIVRGDGVPVTAMEIPTFGRLPALGLCPLFGALRSGAVSPFAFAFQRMGVSPDGSGVVFEVTFENSLIAGLVRNPLTPEQEGIFFVGADGKGLRRLGPPSREPAERLVGLPTLTMPSVPFYINVQFIFSSDGRAVTFTDRGPDPAGEDAAQVVILDIATGARTQVTRLPATPPDPAHPADPVIAYYGFADDETIYFFSRANPADPEGVHPDGLNPEGTFRSFTVKTDGSALAVHPPRVLLPSGDFVPVPRITNTTRSRDVGNLSLPGTPVNLPSFPPDSPVYEIFVTAPDHVLQLTDFHRSDTGNSAVVTDGQRVFFLASANLPELHDSNPSENCQVFSMSVLGDDLRQLTHFGSDRSTFGCFGAVPLGQTGCYIFNLNFDPETQTLLFTSSCDPLGTNRAGDQIFAMRSDGTGLRQLTSMRGVVTAADGSVDVHLPGPIAYQPF